jgi:hypothetical protein
MRTSYFSAVLTICCFCYSEARAPKEDQGRPVLLSACFALSWLEGITEGSLKQVYLSVSPSTDKNNNTVSRDT